MKHNNAMLAIGCLLMLGRGCTDPLSNLDSPIYLTKVEYFDRIDPASEISPKLDYSNVFTIAM